MKMDYKHYEEDKAMSKEMERIDNNILIAEFMGIVFYDDDNQYYDSINGFFVGKELNYHKSWDWLMPVVKKCLDISEEEHDDWEKQYENIDDSFYQVEITQVYEAVVEFIKWYNHEK